MNTWKNYDQPNTMLSLNTSIYEYA